MHETTEFSLSSQVAAEYGTLERLRACLRLLRPYQWVKSGFVFSGYLFVQGWLVPGLTARVLAAALAFALVAGSIYALNDLVDLGRDRLDPVKRSRPLASGLLSRREAALTLILSGLAGFTLGATVSTSTFLLLAAYFLINVLYSAWIKQVVILDVFAIASGFLLRVLVGTVGVEIHPSKWLILCTIMLSLFLGFSKRRAELARCGDGETPRRRVLADYGEKLLDGMIGVAATSAVLTYALYTVDPGTIRFHHTEDLIYTVPIVTYGIFRYLLLLYAGSSGEDASRELFRDPHLLVTLIVWVLTVAIILRF